MGAVRMTWLVTTPFSVGKLVELGCLLLIPALVALRTRSVGVAQVVASAGKLDARVHSLHVYTCARATLPVDPCTKSEGVGEGGLRGLLASPESRQVASRRQQGIFEIPNQWACL